MKVRMTNIGYEILIKLVSKIYHSDSIRNNNLKGTQSPYLFHIIRYLYSIRKSINLLNIWQHIFQKTLYLCHNICCSVSSWKKCSKYFVRDVKSLQKSSKYCWLSSFKNLIYRKALISTLGENEHGYLSNPLFWSKSRMFRSVLMCDNINLVGQ